MPQPESFKPKTAENVLELPQDFSLVLGGPLYQLYLRSRLARPPLHLLRRRLVFIPLICWLPPFLLAALAKPGAPVVADTFLRDPEVHIRLLVALPLLIGAEAFVHSRLGTLVPQFLQRGIVAPQDQPRFQKIIDSTVRLRNSVAAEVILLIVVVTLGHWIWRERMTVGVSSWYAVPTATGLHLTAAGMYYAYVSLAIFRFMLYRWYFRLFLWYRFLWQVRSLPLHLNLYHPDRAGGLGFLSGSLSAFAPVFVAQTAVLAAFIYARILYTGQTLPDFKMEMIVALALYILAIVLPLGFFAPHLEHAGRQAKREFGILSSQYVDDFRQKWVQDRARAGEPLLGTSDIQSLADLANSYGVVRDLRLLPVSKQNLTRLVVMLALPLLPLILTMFPLEEILKRLLKLG
jgi:hypothetical protein